GPVGRSGCRAVLPPRRGSALAPHPPLDSSPSRRRPCRTTGGPVPCRPTARGPSPGRSRSCSTAPTLIARLREASLDLVLQLPQGGIDQDAGAGQVFPRALEGAGQSEQIVTHRWSPLASGRLSNIVCFRQVCKT